MQYENSEMWNNLNTDNGIKDHWNFKQRAMYQMFKTMQFLIVGREDIILTHFDVYSFIVDLKKGEVFRFRRDQNYLNPIADNKINLATNLSSRFNVEEIFDGQNIRIKNNGELVESIRDCSDGEYIGFAITVGQEDEDGKRLLIMKDHQLIALLGKGLIAIEAVGETVVRTHDVHHINEVAQDNRLENLQVLPVDDHKELHKERRKLKSMG